MRKSAVIVACVCLSGCVDWPEAPQTSASPTTGDWPELVPLEEASRIRSTDEASDRDAMRARAAGLNARASVLRRPISSSDDMERLRALMAR